LTPLLLCDEAGLPRLSHSSRVMLARFTQKELCVMELITAAEKAQLQERLDNLKAQRPILSQRIAEARALGDLKENADYHAAREDQGLNEAEIRRLEERLRTAGVADTDSLPKDMVFLGAVVRLRDTDDDSDDLYKIVGEASGSFDADEIEVTAASPMGEALMKARVGETVRVDLPRGTKRFEVIEIL
jgi:transcription elongation factor GreA